MQEVELQLKQNQKGFTLIELIIVVGLIALTVGVTGDIILTLVRTYTRTQIETEVEQNANFIFQKIEKELRGAERIDSVTSGGTQLSFTFKDALDVDIPVVYQVTHGEVRRIEGGNTDILSVNSGIDQITVTCGTGTCFTLIQNDPDIIQMHFEFAPTNTTIAHPLVIENTVIVRRTY